MRRVMVLGCSGAGKSTLARRLGTAIGLPVIHLDRHFWRPRWQLPEPQEWRATVAELAAGTDWVMDGNYPNTYDLRMPRADTMIWLDFPRTICMFRVLMRTLNGYGRTRPDLPQDCPERFEFEFLRYVWDFHAKHRPRIADGIGKYREGRRVFQLTTDRDVENLMSQIGRA